MDRSQLTGGASGRALLAYVAVWGLATAYLAATGGDWASPVMSLLIFGLLFSAVGWFVTRKMDAPAVPVDAPSREGIGMLAYLVIYSVLLIGLGLGAIKQAIPAGQIQEVTVLAYKLLIHVAVPAALILLLGGNLTPLFDSGIKRRGFWTSLIVLSLMMFVLLALVSPSLKQIGALNFGAPTVLFWVLASWAWMSVEAGLCEEFLFRACLQSRLAAWLKSPVAGIAVTSILFALVHWPGLYLRGGPGVDGWSTDPIHVAAFTVATLSPPAVSMGLLWARSRSLLLIVLVHGAIDALPHTAELARIWG